ncbi:hypothetical protein ZEAMMB73_Zm00001d009491 [Zea mays]|uniref:Uncharacterized protein n=1 Tax=Zea mays TaxID=4577 RepID=A0A1D6FJQ3_MAIZE|nr:hypothetical protein ZEAMMB73_Zm00001d009491 [Zea mays]
MFLTWKPRTNTSGRRRSRWRRSSTTRRSLATVSSTSGSSTTWPHASLCSASSGAAAAWTRSRAAAPRCPSSNRGTSWSSPTPTTLGLFWAPHPTTTLSHRPAHHPPEAQPPTCTTSLMSPGCTLFGSPAKSHRYMPCRARSTTTISRTMASSWHQR